MIRVTSDVNKLSSHLVFVEIDMLWNYIYAFLIDQNFDGLVQDCNISIANALEILWSCAKQLLRGWLLRVEIGVYIFDDVWVGSQWWVIIATVK